MKKIYILLTLNFALFTGIKAQYNVFQLMHNSSDPAATNLKIWVNDTVWINNFAFQQSTPRQIFPEGTHTIGISLTTATNQAQSITQQTFAIGDGDYKFLIINGIVNNAQTPLTILQYGGSGMGSPSPFAGDVTFYNGCTNYNNLTVALTPTTMLGSNYVPSTILYNQIDNYYINMIALGGNNTYTITVSSGTTALGSFLLPFSTYGQQILNITMNSSYNLGQKGAGVGFGLVIVPANGGSVTPMTKIETATNLSEVSVNSILVEVSPNPVTDLLDVSFNSIPTEPIHLQITDVTGKISMAINNAGMAKNILDLSHLSQGIYFLTVTQGKASKTVKVVKN